MKNYKYDDKISRLVEEAVDKTEFTSVSELTEAIKGELASAGGRFKVGSTRLIQKGASSFL